MSKEIVPFQFNRDLPKGGGIGIYGASGKGKSSILYELFYHLRNKITASFIVSGTEFQDPFFSKIIPHLCIHDNLDENTELCLKKFYTVHLANVKKWNDKKKKKEDDNEEEDEESELIDDEDSEELIDEDDEKLMYNDEIYEKLNTIEEKMGNMNIRLKKINKLENDLREIKKLLKSRK